jgi:hypothetical protein
MARRTTWLIDWAMAPGPCPAWPAGSPCTGAERPVPTAPLATTTANPSSPSATAGADRPNSRPTWAPVARRDPGPTLDGRAAHRQSPSLGRSST